jgi:subtilisin family serine protease
MPNKLNVLIQTSLLIGVLALAAPAEDRKYVVHLESNTDAATVAARHGMTVVKSLGGSGSGIHVFSAPKGQDAGLMVQSLATDTAVKRAETDNPVTLPGIKAAAKVHPASASAPAFPLDGTLTQYYTGMAAKGYVNQPAASVIKVSDAHKRAQGKGKVAVLDTGVDFLQPVLKSSVIAGWDFVHGQPGGQELADINQETTPILDQETTPILDQETTPILDGGTAIILTQETTPILDQETTPILDGAKYPAYGHGTMVAGLIHLVAPKALIMPVRVFAADGTATISQVVAGIYWAVDHEAKVINMSFSTIAPSDSLKAAIDYANIHGVICVVSAGNDGQSEVVFPAAYSTVIDVASTNDQGIRSLFSNFGPEITLAAPGEAVITTYPGNHYAEVWGTSFSAPLAAGGAALLLDISDDVTPAQARAALTQAVATGQELGAGELDLLQAVKYLSKLRHGQDD